MLADSQADRRLGRAAGICRAARGCSFAFGVRSSSVGLDRCLELGTTGMCGVQGGLAL